MQAAAHRRPARTREPATAGLAVHSPAAGCAAVVVREGAAGAGLANRVAVPTARCPGARHGVRTADCHGPVAGAEPDAAARGSCRVEVPDRETAVAGVLRQFREDFPGVLQSRAVQAAICSRRWKVARPHPRVQACQRFRVAWRERSRPEACAAPAQRRGVAVRPALCPARSPTLLDRSTQALGAARRRGRSLQFSPPDVRRRECRPLSSINYVASSSPKHAVQVRHGQPANRRQR